MGLPVTDPGLTAATITGATMTTVSVDAAAAAQDAILVSGNLQKEIASSSSFAQRAVQFVKTVALKVKDTAIKKFQFVRKFEQAAFMFANFMRMAFQFFSLIIVFRMIIGFFTKPLEFIMLGMSCFVLAITYVIYYILSIPPFIYIPFLIWFIIFDVVPFVVYSIIMGVLFIGISILCLILAGINFITKGSLKSLVLCQNNVAAWFKTPNYHLGNKYERGIMCSKKCYPGYSPDTTGMYCIKIAKDSPSFCPQAEVMRMYTGNRNDMNYYYKDYQTIGNVKYLMKTPEEREILLKNHYLKKRDFHEKCEKSMSQYNSMSLGLCSSLDIYEKNNINGIDKKTLSKMKKVCSQAYCNSKTNYPFCSDLATVNDENDNVSGFWKKIIKILLLIIVFIFIIMFTLSYMVGVKAKL